jgi:hypothetical protein
LLDGAVDLDAGVVDQRVDGAELMSHPRHRRRHLGFGADIARQRQAGAPAERGRRAARRIAVDIERRDLIARGVKGHSQAGADAGAGPGDHGCPAITHSAPPLPILARGPAGGAPFQQPGVFSLLCAWL